MNTTKWINTPETKVYLIREEILAYTEEFYEIINSLTTARHTPWRQQYFLLASVWNERHPDKILPTTPALVFSHYNIKPKDKQEVLELFLWVRFRVDSTVPRFAMKNTWAKIENIIAQNPEEAIESIIPSHQAIYDAFVLYWNERMRSRNNTSDTNLNPPKIAHLIIWGTLTVATTSEYRVILSNMNEKDRALVLWVIEDFITDYEG